MPNDADTNARSSATCAHTYTHADAHTFAFAISRTFRNRI